MINDTPTATTEDLDTEKIDERIASYDAVISVFKVAIEKKIITVDTKRHVLVINDGLFNKLFRVRAFQESLSENLYRLTAGFQVENVEELNALRSLKFNLAQIASSPITPSHKLTFNNPELVMEWHECFQELLKMNDYNSSRNPVIKSFFLGYLTNPTDSSTFQDEFRSIVQSIENNELKVKLIHLFGNEGLNWIDLSR